MSWSRNGATCAVALPMLAVLWGGSAIAPASTTGKGSEKLEVDVTNSPDFPNGQTEVAINPRNPNNLVFTATRFGPSDPVPPGPCFVADSRDRGKTWTEATWPSRTGSNPDTRRNCAPELSGGC
jgi:hypothetical protein